tara:strand:- start:161 stop:982 length:822 start_codon:yes stop_codon:yes gene_type:complete
MLFDLPRAGYKDVKIPLSPAIFKRVWPKSVRSKVFHLTDYEGVQRLIKLQGKKKSISAFYNIAVDRISYGIQTEGGYVIEMDADVLAAAPDDISSQPDKTGRRWLTWSTILEEMGGGSKIKKMEKDLSELLMDLVMKYAEDPKYMPNINKSWTALGKEYESRSKEDNKVKSLIIKDYIDGMEKIMKKYSKPLQSIFTDYTKKRTLDPDEDSGEVQDWDELVVNNFKIIKIHVGPEYADDFMDDKDIYGFPFALYTDDGDLADYITRTVQRIKL